MKEDDVSEVLKNVGISDSNTLKQASKILSAITTLLEKNDTSFFLPQMSTSINNLRRVLNDFHDKISSQWKPEKKSKYKEAVNEYLRNNWKKNRFLKYIITPLVFTDFSVYSNYEIDDFKNTLTALSRDDIFELYNHKICWGNKKTNHLCSHFNQRFYETLGLKRTEYAIEQRILTLQQYLKKLEEFYNIEFRRFDERVNNIRKAMENTSIRYITILGVFTAIISFIIINISTELTLPSMFIFAGILFLFVVLLRFLSVYGDKPWHWILIVILCVFLISTGIITYYLKLLSSIFQ